MVMVVVMPTVMVMMGVDINTNNANAGPEPSDLARRLVSEISKVSHRYHCRSDPVRVQSVAKKHSSMTLLLIRHSRRVVLNRHVHL